MTRTRTFAKLAVLAALLATAASCADDGPKFSVNYAPGFVKDGVQISVLGVFRDGRMNPEAWDELGPRFSAALHKEECDVAVGTRLRAQQSAVFAAFDAVARAEGITDELLDKLAPAASGDSILVVTVAGRPPGAKDGGAGASSSAPQLSTTGRGGGRGGRRGGAPRSSAPHTHHGGPDTNVFEISASLFSKRQHQSVAMVAMTYTGSSEEEAIAKFVEKLASAFPGAVCTGWNADLGLDVAAIRQLGEH
jgi:hypothetical protein